MSKKNKGKAAKRNKDRRIQREAEQAEQEDFAKRLSFTLEKVKSFSEFVRKVTLNALSVLGWVLLFLLLVGLAVFFVLYLVALWKNFPLADSIHKVVQVLSGASSLGVGICGLVMSAKSSEETEALKQMVSNIKIELSEENVSGVHADNERY